MGSKRHNSSGSPSPQENVFFSLVGGAGVSSASSGSNVGSGHLYPASSTSSTSASRSLLRRVSAALGLCLILVMLVTVHMHARSLDQLAERRHYLELLQGASSLLLHGHNQPPQQQLQQQEHALPTEALASEQPSEEARELRSHNGPNHLLRGHSTIHGSRTRTGSRGVNGEASADRPARQSGVGGGFDVVAGMATHMDPKYLAVFLLSLRRVSPSSDVVLFVDAATARDGRVRDIVARADALATAQLATNTAKERGFSNHGGASSSVSPGLGRIVLSEFDDASFPEHMRSYHPSSKRWTLLHSYFQSEEVRARYRFVLLVDVRDTAFQRDPFAAASALATESTLPSQDSSSRGSASASVFFTFTDNEAMTLASCDWNAGWVQDCFGNEMLQRIGGEGIVCSGVSVGTADAVWEYLRRMHAIISRTDKSDNASLDGYALPPSLFPQCERNGVDQGVHNVLMRTPGVFPPHMQVRIWPQGEGPVVNMQARVYAFDEATATAAVSRSHQGDSGVAFPEVLAQKASGQSGPAAAAVAVAHQYDRNSAVQAALFKQYVYWMDTADPMAEWAASAACARFAAPQLDVDLFKGVCDVEDSGGATSPAACCARCLPGRCGGFVFLGSTCFLKAPDCPAASRTRASLPGGLSAFVGA